MLRLMLRVLLRLLTGALILYLGVWMVAALSEAFGFDWNNIPPLRGQNAGISPVLFAMGALVLAVASLCLFLYEQVWNRKSGWGTTPPALYFGLFSLLLFQVALLFATDSVYGFLWAKFK